MLVVGRVRKERNAGAHLRRLAAAVRNTGADDGKRQSRHMRRELHTGLMRAVCKVQGAGLRVTFQIAELQVQTSENQTLKQRVRMVT